MSQFDDVMQQYVDRSYEELVAIARNSVAQFSPVLMSRANVVGAAFICGALVSLCIGADGTMTNLEHRFFNDMLCYNYSYNDALNFVRMYNTPEMRSAIEQIVHNLDVITKAHVIAFCACFMAVDETIDHGETAFIQRLMQ